mmetsp:Transcript_12629/g.19350  ORF Transcript_12629/g.19350 Transcript_12629/m.19350 type:complete len:161 (-) Transcript_12629:79-561(-)
MSSSSPSSLPQTTKEIVAAILEIQESRATLYSTLEKAFKEYTNETNEGSEKKYNESVRAVTQSFAVLSTRVNAYEAQLKEINTTSSKEGALCIRSLQSLEKEKLQNLVAYQIDKKTSIENGEEVDFVLEKQLKTYLQKRGEVITEINDLITELKYLLAEE